MSRHGSDDGTESKTVGHDLLRRREYLAATAGVTILAGCLGDDDDPGDSADGDGNGVDDGNGDDEVDPEDLPTMARLGETTLPDDMNVNGFAQSTPGGHTLDLCHDIFATNPHQGEVILRAIDDWDWDPDEQILTKTLRDDLVFWNGDQFTAEDLWSYDEVSRLTGPDTSKYESIEVVDDLSVEYTIREPPNTVLVRNTELPGHTYYHNIELWEEFIEQFQDVSNEDERDEVTADLVEFSNPLEEWVEGRGGTGVFEIADWSETEITYEQVAHGEHRFSDDVDVQRLKMHLTEYGSAQADQLFAGGDIDMHTSALDDQYASVVPDYVENVLLTETMYSYQVLINQRNVEALQDHNVRRAMACVLNTENVVTNFGETRGNPIQDNTGMEPGSDEQYWGDDLGELIDYSPQEGDYERADHFLEQSGYSREDGTIYKPDGDELETITFYNGSDFLFQVPGETIDAQLQEYGFPIEYTGVPRSQKLDIVSDQMGEWDLAMESHWPADGHASSYFSNEFYQFGYRLAPSNGQLEEWIDDEERSPYTGREFKPEIPTELGQEDLSGDTKEVDVFRTYQRARASEDEQEVAEAIRDLSHMWNFHMPNLDVLHLVHGNIGNTRDYNWPDENTLEAHSPNAPYRVIHDGTVTYTDEARYE